MNSEEPLAHSAKPDKGILAQTYAEHITGVSDRADKNMSAMAAYSNGDAQLLVETLRLTSALHDLGKLDEKNQKVLRTGGRKSLPINHVDAGTAHLLGSDGREGAIFVYGHHIGLCAYPQSLDSSRANLS